MLQLELHNAIWLFVVVFMLHDFEEIITVEHWAKRNESLVRSKNSKLADMIWKFWNVSSYSFAKRDVFIFLTMSIITFLKVQYIDSTWSAVLFIGFLLFVLIHNLVHILQTIVLQTYTPGLYTSIFLVTPYVIYLLNQIG
ncbi:HXXEE domain-containing protein [Paenibacillus sp. CAU 1523]|uniref:HXXEE domain-containing protein n=1 Tax=Paenibacillus arenosi TaxID=2774142 RepID=A0ABR9B0P3_9BACL|nr:HXXEE domain-containing protein [Paenibacillus arenosi]